MSSGGSPGGEDTEAAREAMGRAIRRLSALENLLLVAVVVVALIGGALAAWLLSELMGLPFRPIWILASVLLFVIPGVLVYGRERWGRPTRPVTDPPQESSNV